MVQDFFEFHEISICGSCDGRINVASINVRNGIIILQKEETPIRRQTLDDSFQEDFSLPRFVGMKILNRRVEKHHKGEQRKPIRENLKTMPESKKQRANRALLGQLKKATYVFNEFYD